jgi:hypothetical protein
LTANSQLGRCLAGLTLAAALGCAAWGQMPASTGAATGQSGTSAATGRTVQGRVVNALSGATIARALVSLNNRSVLTDSEGRFAFPDFTDASASAMVSKPGFSATASGALAGAGRQRIADLDASLELKLYPDAVISGTLTDGEGLPLERVSVLLMRQTMQSDGMRWLPIRNVQTTHRGEFRFREPAGRFRLSVNALVRADVVLPVLYPGQSASDGLGYFQTAPGEEKQIDLRARTSPAYQVTVRLEPAEMRGLQFSAVTSEGESFPVPLAGMSNGGVLVSLPTGSFTLRARLENREALFTGAARVTVTGPRSEPVTIHLEPAASLPVELSIDQTNASSANSYGQIAQAFAAPDARQFNLRLERLDESPGLMNQDIQLRINDDKSEAFQVPPGRYRLLANGGGGQWYIESATYGVANLMTSEISIGSGGGGGTPIRLVVSSAKGTVSGTVKLPANTSGTADAIWIYLIPRGPSLGPIYPILLGINGAATATFTQTIPPGSYLAVAMNHQSEQDLRDPEVQARLSTAGKTVEIAAGATANVDLETAPDSVNGASL